MEEYQNASFPRRRRYDLVDNVECIGREETAVVKRARKLDRLTVAELNQLIKKPEAVELTDLMADTNGRYCRNSRWGTRMSTRVWG